MFSFLVMVPSLIGNDVVKFSAEECHVSRATLVFG